MTSERCSPAKAAPPFPSPPPTVLLFRVLIHRANLQAIAEWCATTYVMPGQDKQATVEATRRYMKDGLETVVNKIGAAATAVTQTLELQAFEFERLDAWVSAGRCVRTAHLCI